MEQHKPLDWILITDADLIVRGLGVSALHDAELGGIPLPDIDFPWTGFLCLSIGRLPFQAFGVLDDALVCNLNLPTIRDRIDQIKKMTRILLKPSHKNSIAFTASRYRRVGTMAGPGL